MQFKGGMNLNKYLNNAAWFYIGLALIISTSCSNSNAKTNKTVEHKVTKEESLLMLSNQTLEKIQSGEFSQFISLVHPVKGLRFSPYGHIDTINTKPLSINELNFYYTKDDLLFFGFADGSGDSINLNLKTYLQTYVQTPNYLKSHDIFFNQIHQSGYELVNMDKVFVGADFIEYYFSGFDKQYEGMDWKALRLVWEKYEDKWCLVGIVRACWTI